LRKSRETIGPNVDIRATTEFNACQDWHQITAQNFKQLYDVRANRTIMAKVIEFYVRDLFPAEVKSVPRDRGGVIEFPKATQP